MLAVFEAAARHLSFTRAAAELHVTQAAVSRRVRELEDRLGLPLFRRLHRRVELTPAGTRLAARLGEALDLVSTAVAEIAGDGGAPARSLVLSVEPAFAAKWLLPRLAGFRARHPGIDLSVDSDPALATLGPRGADLAIRHAETAQAWPGTNAVPLAEVWAGPVLAPRLLASGPPLASPADLAAHVHLGDEEDWSSWVRWYAQAGQPGIGFRRGSRLSDHALVLDAAVRGHGVALGSALLAAEELGRGDLVAPRLGDPVRIGAYWLVAPAAAGAANPATSAFASWVTAEARAGLPDVPALIPSRHRSPMRD
jgi:LysR family glycine cleavage system transcriptional activator